MIRTIYIDAGDWSSNADEVVRPEFRVDLVCGAPLGGTSECDAPRASLILSGGLLLIFGPPAGTINRAPGTNAYDHLDHTSSTLPGAAHQLWQGYPIGYDFEGDLSAQALWKIRFRGCLEHNPTPDLSVLATNLRDTMLALQAAGWPDVPLSVGQLDAAVDRLA